ncbi:hypothetical protein F4776DRAFT_619829 [Hypoxylon sp. NC0597]|nr:hypothetical protein F4776DRAFT_619829 [Hypoxylon sp. NC0597]
MRLSGRYNWRLTPFHPLLHVGTFYSLLHISYISCLGYNSKGSFLRFGSAFRCLSVAQPEVFNQVSRDGGRDENMTYHNAQVFSKTGSRCNRKVVTAAVGSESMK